MLSVYTVRPGRLATVLPLEQWRKHKGAENAKERLSLPE